jgi:hypothetical protein
MTENTNDMAGYFPFLTLAILTLLVGMLFTVYVMRKNRKLEYGHVEGMAVDPRKVLRDNLPDAQFFQSDNIFREL